ncbi:hypothetical protein SLEP1_g45945 [Rubroshorea leprosula]|uniref:Uncharacterized protein n=1 Tax=Rubroshorea leprosula TaxID=152421 RepID=A0AAV5LN17_9ROSI|nr:hypothetical protein SLEP1_g45945 [Rubroshorea leprosula]
MDPRISFSNDFADPHQAIKYQSNYREAPVSSDFEFSVSNYAMIPADEIFFKGMMLPLKDNQERKMTLREELLVDDDDDDFIEGLPRLQKGSGWWKDRLGLKRDNMLSRKYDSVEVHQRRGIEEKRTVLACGEESMMTKKT